MYNEITRKLTSLTLMSIMVAGGLTFAIPGFMPSAYAEELSVSASVVGNFAGIQVIEIVVDDPDRNETNESEGRPNVELNSDDVLMTQGTDGIWYAYVANQLALDNFAGFNSIYGSDLNQATITSGTDSQAIYANATTFLDGFKDANAPDGSQTNNEAGTVQQWPFIQSYDISDGSDVTITYGSGSTAESIVLEYDYDDDKDLSLDRSLYPDNAQVHATIDDSLLNLSPTADDIWLFGLDGSVTYRIEASGGATINTVVTNDFESLGFEEGPLAINNGTNVFALQDTQITDAVNENTDQAIIFKTSDTNDNVFVNYDSNERSSVVVQEEGEAFLGWNDNHSIVFDTFNGAIKFLTTVDEWLSGVELAMELHDEDRNLNTRIDEDMLILDGEVPYIQIGDPITVDEVTLIAGNGTGLTEPITFVANSETDSKTIGITIPNGTTNILVNATWPTNLVADIDNGFVFPFVNFDFTQANGTSGTHFTGFTNGTSEQLPAAVTVGSDSINASFNFTNINVISTTATSFDATVYFDLFTFGQEGDVADADGELNENIDRVNNAFYRFELEETDDNTATFEGDVEYIMINQLNVFDLGTYDDIDTADDSLVIIVNDDLDSEDAVRVNYEDIDSTGSDETISVQEDANTHNGVIELDKTFYSTGNTITVTLRDADLNTDSETIQIYDTSSAQTWVGDDDVWLVQMLIDDVPFAGGCSNPNNLDLSLDDANFSFIETDEESGIFVGTLKLPTEHCIDSNNDNTIDGTDTTEPVNGLDIEFEYQDFSDASGEPNETSVSASIRSNTGSISFDRSVYPVPFTDSQFAVHESVTTNNFLPAGDLNVIIQVNDPDFNVSANGEDTLPSSNIQLELGRGSLNHTIAIASTNLLETAPDSGIFELDVALAQQTYSGLSGQIEQGDILTVTYTDPADASGEANTVTDSATFDLRNGVLQTDKSVYIIGSDAIITLIEPDLNLDSDSSETLDLRLINWDSDAGDVNLDNAIFDAEPFGLRETADGSGIFQTIIEIPDEIGGDKLERGEEIELEYIDEGPAGANFVGQDDEDIVMTIFTSNFGATVELDQKVYTWTDKVFITIVAPDHNFDSDAIDEIGSDSDSELEVSTREGELDLYKLVETGSDTGIFTGEVILTGFDGHDADGDGTPGDASGVTSPGTGGGPTNGLLGADDDDGLTVSFEFSDGEVVLGSALIRWNIGEVQWLEASYPATGTGVIRVIDPDMNLNPESVDSFEVNVWSDTAAGGISLDVTETNEATGIFEGTVFFTVSDSSSGSRLAVSEGDTITAEYEDNTLPDPYSTADELDITATAVIGTIVPPLERAPIGNMRAIDAFGNSLNTVTVDQQIQIAADISNGQDRNQEFAYLVQIQDENGVTVSLSWITGSLTPGQSLQVSASWIPEDMGSYEATAFAWQSIDNPTALSPPANFEITVN